MKSLSIATSNRRICWFAGEETVGMILASSWQFVGGGFQGQVGATNAAGWAPHSPVFAEALADHTVVAWDIDTEIGMATCIGHTRKVLALAWSPDGTKLVTGSQDMTVKIWDIPDVTQVTSALKAQIYLVIQVIPIGCWRSTGLLTAVKSPRPDVTKRYRSGTLKQVSPFSLTKVTLPR